MISNESSAVIDLGNGSFNGEYVCVCGGGGGEPACVCESHYAHHNTFAKVV